MIRPSLLVKPSSSTTRLLMTLGEDEMLRAVLPPPTAAHSRAAATLCEALSLWLQRPLSVVLCADDQGASSALGLCDGFGFGTRTVHYEVEVVDPTRRRRGLGSFRDLRQLQLRGLR
jgi:hypothetical protein